MVDGHAFDEHGQADECRRDGIRVGDGARVEHGTDDVHGTHPGREHDMRGDGVGVGDVGEVPDRARLAGHASGGDDGGCCSEKRDSILVCRPELC